MNPWTVRAKGGALSATGARAPALPVRSHAHQRQARKPRSERPRVRHPDLAPQTTLRQSDLEPPSQERPGVIVLEFDPGLPMTVIHKRRRYVYDHRAGEHAIYLVMS